MKKTNNDEAAFFASSNSFMGFRSYFKEIFDSRTFDAIYVIKGGPGCGKSSAMKKCRDVLLDSGVSVEEIYCSSDLRSLDGLILEGKGRAAVLDGTAPHERDAVIPGAVDTLVDLGECWLVDRLKRSKDEILYMNENKGREYSSAYNELRFSFEYWRNIKAECENGLDVNSLRNAKSVLSDQFDLSAVSRKIRLISSFSKDGYKTLSPCPRYHGRYSVSGDKMLSAVLMTALTDQKSGADTLFPSPLDPCITEGFVDSDGRMISIHNVGEPLFCADDFFSFGTESERRVEYLKSNMMLHLDNAKDHLAEASRYHLSLEEIYTAAMNFDAANEKVDKMIKNIKNILLS